MTTPPRNTDSLGLADLLAMGIGGMIGGGIFSVLGIAVGIAGHAAALAFVLGGIIAALTAYSYIRLAMTFRSDGASFTYLEKAFPTQPNIAGAVGWVLIVGYIGTMALYAFTFGAYGADLLGTPQDHTVRIVLSAGVLLFFMSVNLRGVQSSGTTEVLIVATKVILLGLFTVAGTVSVTRDHVLPVFDQGAGSVLVAGATVFVAFEGFELITNAVCETKNPERNIPRGIYGSVVITTLIYLGVAFVAVGSLTADQLLAAREYALAVAAEPALGNAGRVLVGIAALLATSSAINATGFGASRMMAEMSTERVIPHAFSFRARRTNVPAVAVVTLTLLAIALTGFGTLDIIASFSSLTFLIVSIGVCAANLKLRKQTKSSAPLVMTTMLLITATIALLLAHLWDQERATLGIIGLIYAAVLAAELVFGPRRLGSRHTPPDASA